MRRSAFPLIVGILTIVVGATVLFGWVQDIESLRTPISDQVSMKANTALGFIISGLLLILANSGGGALRTLFRWALVALIFLLAGATLSQYLFGVDLRFDQWIVVAPANALQTISPGRMAPTTTLSFMLFAATIAIDHWQTGVARGVSRTIATLLVLVALTSLMGYAYGAPALYLGIDGVTAMSLPSALLFLALGLGAVWLHPQFGFPAMLREKSIVGTHIRSLLPMIVGAPLLVGAAVAAGYGRVYEGQFAIALTSLGSVIAAGLVGIVSIIVLRRADDALLIRERALAATADGVTITDHRSADEPIVFTNAAFSDLTGFTQEEALGRNCRFLNAGSGNPSRIMDALRQCIQEAEDGVFELRNRRKDGSKFWNLLSLSPITNYEGTVTHFVGISRDVTETRDRERQLKRALAEARSANSMRDTFVRLASHELRTPLNAALTWIRLMDVDDSETTRSRGLEVVAQSIESQSRLIDDLVDVTRFSAAGVQLETETSNVAELLRVTVEELRPTIEAEQSISVNAPGEIQADVDPLRVQQIMRNLITNAHKYTPDGGSIQVAMEKGPEYLTLTVTDTGVGLEEDEISQVFEPFWRGKSHQPGLGVGLAIVAALVAAHNGSIDVASPGRDQGSRFVVRLPYTGALSGRFLLQDNEAQSNDSSKTADVNPSESDEN